MGEKIWLSEQAVTIVSPKCLNSVCRKVPKVVNFGVLLYSREIMANPDKNKVYKENLSNSCSLYLKAILFNLLIRIKYLLTYYVLNIVLVF